MPEPDPLITFVGPSKPKSNKAPLTKHTDCYLRQCRQYCIAGRVGEQEPWCFLTEGQEGDYKYAKCTADYECDVNWKCAGPCRPQVSGFLPNGK